MNDNKETLDRKGVIIVSITIAVFILALPAMVLGFAIYENHQAENADEYSAIIKEHNTTRQGSTIVLDNGDTFSMEYNNKDRQLMMPDTHIKYKKTDKDKVLIQTIQLTQGD